MAQSDSDWITANEAAERLGVKKETIYAYVSRGRLASQRMSAGRGTLIDPSDVERLAHRAKRLSRGSTDPLESEITLVTDAELYYRGIPARTLADERSFEDVAAMLWDVDPAPGAWSSAKNLKTACRRILKTLDSSLLPADMVKAIAGGVAAYEPPIWDHSREVVAAAAKRVLATLVQGLPERTAVDIEGTDFPFAGMLWSRLGLRSPSQNEVRLLNATMVMLADHDLAAATYAVRVAARTGVDPSGLVRLGIDVGSGPVKGAASLAIEALFRELQSPDVVEAVLARRLRQGDRIQGFGHPVYPHGDVRAHKILEDIRVTCRDDERLVTVEEVLKIQNDRGLPSPNAGFALAALSYVLDLAPGAGELIFVMSRAAGWVAHAIEEYEGEPMERLRSKYVGKPPGSTPGVGRYAKGGENA